MSNGKIVEQGNPKQLLSEGGQFSSMFKEFNGEIPFKIEDDLSMTNLGDVSVRLPISEIPTLKITKSERIGEVNYKDGDRTWTNLTPRQPFPLSQPEIIILENQAGEEVATIKDTERLEYRSEMCSRKQHEQIVSFSKLMGSTRL